MFNCTVQFIEDLPVPSDQFASDACTDGGDAFYKGDLFYVNWHIDCLRLEMERTNAMELHAVGIAAEIWGSQWANAHLVVHADNMNSMFAIDKGTCHSKPMMCSLRRLFWLSAVNNFYLIAFYLPGKENIISYCLSRLPDPPLLQFCSCIVSLGLLQRLESQTVLQLAWTCVLPNIPVIAGQVRSDFASMQQEAIRPSLQPWWSPPSGPNQYSSVEVWSELIVHVDTCVQGKAHRWLGKGIEVLCIIGLD